jgi:tetratricopeptide (TPR) repeat protein
MGLSNISQLIHGLKSSEVALIRRHYKSIIEKRGIVKRLELFNIIKTNKERDDISVCQKLYKKNPDGTYRLLLVKLRDDILKLLLLQDSAVKFNSKIAQAEFDSRRMITEGFILISRGITKEGISILKRAEKIASEYELFNESIMANELLLEVFTLPKGEVAYSLYKNKINIQLKNLEAHLKAKTYYHKIISPSLFKLKDQDEYINFAGKATEELKVDYETTQSKKVGYYYYYIATLYHNLSKNYSKALHVAEKFLEINTQSKAVSSKRTIATAYLQLSYINLQLKNYSESIKQGENALKNFKSGLLNELTTLELLFLAHYYNGNEAASEAAIKKALSHPKLNSNKFLPAKWHFYKAWFLFSQKQFDAANNAMNDCTYLLEDKTGWLYGYRILDIMITLECNELFLVDGKIAGFKKIIGKQKDINSSRAKTILRVLDTLVRKHYDYALAVKNQKANITVLQEAKADHLWEPMGYELIRFEEWFATKLPKRKTQ